MHFELVVELISLLFTLYHLLLLYMTDGQPTQLASEQGIGDLPSDPAKLMTDKNQDLLNEIAAATPKAASGAVETAPIVPGTVFPESQTAVSSEQPSQVSLLQPVVQPSEQLQQPDNQPPPADTALVVVPTQPAADEAKAAKVQEVVGMIKHAQLLELQQVPSRNLQGQKKI